MSTKICKIKYFIFSYFFAKRTYKKEILSSSFFERISSIGWEWAYYDKKYRKLSGKNKDVPFPVGFSVVINHPENFVFSPEDLNIFQTPGCYFQGIGAKTTFGKGCIVAPNCGFITANHDFFNFEKHSSGKEIIIGDHCWIGMNSTILPGVILGNNTIVGAGSVVTKCFPEGNCVICGNPAVIIRKF